MPTPLVMTKFVTPPLRARAFPRPLLLEILNRGLDGKLTLISAPAGFGKTTLVVTWLDDLAKKGTGKRIAWFSLDESDNDPVRFWGGLVAALQSIWPGIGQEGLSMLKSPQPVPVEMTLTVLVNEITSRIEGGPHLLVLDDLQAITTPQIISALAFLLEHLPAGLHLVVTTRIDPDFPLARLRARQQLTEIRLAELRFTPAETATFMNQCMGLCLSEADIHSLEARTEGWITGLQMAALSLQNSPDTAKFIHAFTGSNRYILDYLLEEVLQREQDDVQVFLLKTSILDRLCADLCETVTGGLHGQEMLEHLEDANLFLIPLDYERRWYRYHPLFGELLRSQLEKSYPGQAASLHGKSAEWFEARGDLEQAARHQLTAQDFAQASRLIEQVALDILSRGEVGTLVAWLHSLPDEILRTHPWLCVLDAWMLILTGQAGAIETRLKEAEAAIQLAGMPDSEALRVRAYASAIRAQVTFIQGGAPAAIEFARFALDHLTAADHVISATTATILGAGYAYMANFSSAVTAFDRAKATSLAGGNQFNAMVASSALAQIAAVNGQLRHAHQIYQDGLHLAGKSAFMAPGYTYAGLANVLCEWNELDSALEYAAQSVELCKLIGQAEILMTAYTSLARVQLARREFDAALTTLEEARRVASEISAWSLDTILILQARVWLAKGELEPAIRWVENGGYTVDEAASFHREQGLLTLARIRMAQGQPEQVAALLERLRQEAESSGRVGSLIEIGVLQAMNFKTQGDARNAQETLSKILVLAKPEGYLRVFLEEGEAMRSLIEECRRQTTRPDPYLQKLLGAYPPRPTTSRSALIEPLSERELEVLHLLAVGRSNSQIAKELYVSLNTVKAHVKNIFVKLGVHNRTEAIHRAQELDLI
jgi:LuxR family maltose regulon positive regulatory protein